MLHWFKNWHPINFIIFSLFFNYFFILGSLVVLAYIIKIFYPQEVLIYSELYNIYILILYVPLILYQSLDQKNIYKLLSLILYK